MPTNIRQRAPLELGSDRTILAVFFVLFAIIAFAVFELTFTKVTAVAERGAQSAGEIASY